MNHMMKVALSTLLAQFLWVPSSFAVAEKATVPVDTVSTSSNVLQVVLGLGVVVGTILVLAWGLKKVSGIQIGNRRLKVIATLPLSTRERVALIQVGEKQILVGVAPGRVSLLESFDQPVIEPEEDVESFADKLKKSMEARLER
jgi:flagellar protein FliO/FliZ